MAVDPVDGLEALELQLQSTERDGSVIEKWLLLSLFVAVICTSGCPWPKAIVKSPVGARDLRPL